MMTPALWLSHAREAAPVCSAACAYPPSTLADEPGAPFILSPAAREVAIDWRRAPRQGVRVVHLVRH